MKLVTIICLLIIPLIQVEPRATPSPSGSPSGPPRQKPSSPSSSGKKKNHSPSPSSKEDKPPSKTKPQSAPATIGRKGKPPKDSPPSETTTPISKDTPRSSKCEAGADWVQPGICVRSWDILNRPEDGSCPSGYVYVSENGACISEGKWKCALSPLVFDINHDSAISVIKGQGVHLNPKHPSVRNGAAIGGDRMLAMCDFSGNGEVDYREVFGDGTHNPFMNQVRLNVSDGFKALNRIAESASQRFSDLNLRSHFEDGSELVNMPQLKIALQRIDCDLGFISDNNTRFLEPLGDVVWVKVTNYLNTPKDISDGIWFGQKSWYMNSVGQRWGVDDVWFPADGI